MIMLIKTRDSGHCGLELVVRFELDFDSNFDRQLTSDDFKIDFNYSNLRILLHLTSHIPPLGDFY